MNPEIIQQLTAIKMPGSALREVLRIVSAIPTAPVRSPRSERNQRYYAKRLNSDASKTPYSDACKTLDASEIKTPPSPPLSPSLDSPPIAPTPEHTHGAPAYMREEPPHKRISWTPQGGWTGITDADRESWAASAPACDLARQLASAGEWLKENPSKARKSNFYRFFGNWLRKAQDRGGDTTSNPRQNGNNLRTHRPATVVTRNTAELPDGRPSLDATAATANADELQDWAGLDFAEDAKGGPDHDS